MRLLILFSFVFLLNQSFVFAQNIMLDSLITAADKIENVDDKILYFKKMSEDTSYSDIALELLQEAKTYSTAYRLPIDLKLYEELGRRYTDNFMFEQAINIYDTLANFHFRQKDTSGWVKSLDALSRNYLRAGIQDSALESLLKAETIIDKTNNKMLQFRIHYGIAHFYLVTSNPRNLPHEYLDVCRNIADELDSDSLRFDYFLEKARLYVFTAIYDSAEYFFEKVGDLVNSSGDFGKLDQYYNSLAIYYQSLEKHDLALDAYLKSYRINLDKDNFVGLYVNCYNIFTFYNARGDLENAEKYLIKSLKYAEITKIQQYKIATYQQLHLFYSSNKNFEKAYEYLLLMNQSVESMHFRELTARIADLTIRYDVLKSQDEITFLTQENQIQSLKIRNDKLIIYGLVILMIGIALYFILIWRQNKIKTKQKTDQLTLKNLMQQMNPHFIFNTLNSIQYYMYNHSELDTNDYISKFASLIRRILDNSNQNGVKLSDELETVGLYIQLEKIRFDDGFDYQISIDPEVNPDEFKIPSMFIQPFVENAIIHGLRHRKERGQLSLEIKLQKNDIVEITVEDNGVGRNKSDHINSQTGHKHNSKALGIAKDRLKLLSSIYNKKLNIQYIDKTESDICCGTKVIIELPLIKN
ncbi:MAG: histidine kinase [Bacteroidales bacterium]|nr:histidine kinase [Bacteroidales bacterium]